jgi:hypothetical protein
MCSQNNHRCYKVSFSELSNTKLLTPLFLSAGNLITREVNRRESVECRSEELHLLSEKRTVYIKVLTERNAEVCVVEEWVH